jgi:hypothetical protein
VRHLPDQPHDCMLRRRVNHATHTRVSRSHGCRQQHGAAALQQRRDRGLHTQQAGLNIEREELVESMVEGLDRRVDEPSP